MAQQSSFDVTTGVDLQEVDNAVNQAQKEIAQRYDFKGSKASIDFRRGENMLVLVADDDFKMRALFDVLQGRLIKRGVPVKNLDIGAIVPAGGDTVRREVKLKMSLDGDTAKKSRGRDQGRQAQEGTDGDSGRSGARVVGVEGRPAGSDRAVALEGLRRRAPVRQLSLVGKRSLAFAGGSTRYARCGKHSLRSLGEAGATDARPALPQL